MTWDNQPSDVQELTLKVSKQAATRNNLVLSLRAHGRLPWLPLTTPPLTPPLPPPFLSPTLTTSTTIPSSPPWPTLMPQHPIPLPAPLTIGVVQLPVDSKPQTSFPSHHILLSDLDLFPSVMFIAIATDMKLEHHFLPSVVTIDDAEWLHFCSTHLHSLIPSPILIWDPGSNFGAMVVAPTP
ncbi:hypothetical protein HKD37_07G019446 [Glycine soja]